MRNQKAADENPIKDLLDVKQVADMLGISVRTVWRMDKEKMIPKSTRFGRRKKWNKNDLILWIQQGFPDRTEFENLKRKG